MQPHAATIFLNKEEMLTLKKKKWLCVIMCVILMLQVLSMRLSLNK